MAKKSAPNTNLFGTSYAIPSSSPPKWIPKPKHGVYVHRISPEGKVTHVYCDVHKQSCKAVIESIHRS